MTGAIVATLLTLAGAIVLFVIGAWWCLLCRRCHRHYFAWGDYCSRCTRIMKGKT